MEQQSERMLDAGVEDVLAVLTDEDYLLAKFDALGHEEGEVLEAGPAGDGYRIRTRRRIEVPLPAIARKVLSPSNTFEQVDEWGPADAAGGRDGTWHATVKGAPVRLQGTMRLDPADAGRSRYTVTATMKVEVPIVGGRIAQALSGDTRRQLDADGDHLASHLAG